MEVDEGTYRETGGPRDADDSDGSAPRRRRQGVDGAVAHRIGVGGAQPAEMDRRNERPERWGWTRWTGEGGAEPKAASADAAQEAAG